MERIRQNSTYLWLASILLLGAFLRFYSIGSKTIWLDEAFSIWVAHHTLVDGWYG